MNVYQLRYFTIEVLQDARDCGQQGISHSLDLLCVKNPGLGSEKAAGGRIRGFAIVLSLNLKQANGKGAGGGTPVLKDEGLNLANSPSPSMMD